MFTLLEERTYITRSPEILVEPTLLDFERDNKGYMKWVAQHPDGYVLNLGIRPHTSKNPRINQMLHRATCRYANKRGTSGGRVWKKVCSLDKDELIRYGEQREGEPAAFCRRCMPHES